MNESVSVTLGSGRYLWQEWAGRKGGGIGFEFVCSSVCSAVLLELFDL